MIQMVENPNFVERVFFGQAHPISYFFAGFVGSAFVGFIILYLYKYLGTFAAHNYQEIPPSIVMLVGVSLLTASGLTYSGWIWFGCWNYFRRTKHWLPSLILGCAVAHAGVTLVLVFSFLLFSVQVMPQLNDGLWILRI